MDKGAARSRKREALAAKAAERAESRLALLLDDKNNRGAKGKGKEDRKEGKERKERAPRPEKKRFDPSDKSQYRPKAIRSAQALIFSSEAFAIPPPSERLAGVTRVDLEGSACDDVSWLAGTGVTWLSLKGCPVTKGWDAVGGLSGLSVLNISGCGLTALPKELAGLSALKALVAMNNDWEALDDAVVGGWTQLNSMIVSHSPNLTSLPCALAELPHLSKLTISHCARLSAASLPDLSPLPLLRDVRANNLPRLSALPPHIATWGTGNLALVGKVRDEEKDEEDGKSKAKGKGKDKSKDKDSERSTRGDGLEVLDLGNCSLPLSAISTLFALSLPPGGQPKHVWKLRSITLQANPLTLEDEKYAEQLQASPALPRLQIIDSKRVVERKNAGAVPESKAERKARERQEKKMRPTGANTSEVGAMRAWGADKERKDKGGKRELGEKRSERPEKKRKRDEAPKTERKVRDKESREETRAPPPKKRKERYFEVAAAEAQAEAERAEKVEKTETKAKPEAAAAATPVATDAPAAKKRKRKHGKSQPNEPEAPTPAPAAPAHTPAKQTSRPAKDGKRPDKKTPSKSETAVVGVVEVAKPKAGGVDLKNMFAKEAKETDTGLGVGGW